MVCIVAPSRGPEHRYPLDCWRYYPDGLSALAKWAGLSVIEAKTCWGQSGFSDGSDLWGDSFCILRKDAAENPAQNVLFRKPAIGAKKRTPPHEIGKPVSYYFFTRNDVINTILKSGISAKRVLEIGCAGGATGKKLKESLAAERYVGIEISEEAATAAKRCLDQVIVADIEKTDLRDYDLIHGSFDLVLFLDVLEHLYDPWNTLSRLTEFLKSGGYVVASIPNIQNISVLRSLISGKWKYEEAGLLDLTHIRFFTRKEIEQMFVAVGLYIEKIERVLNPAIDLSQVKDRGNKINIESLSLTDLTKEDVLDLLTYQYILVAKKGGRIGK